MWSPSPAFYTNPNSTDSNYNGIPDGQEAGGRYLDVDGDGMPTSWEINFPCLNPSVADAGADPDGDGLSNLKEYQVHTNPCSQDSDGDNLTDGQEVNVTLTDPASNDTDGDGLGDGEEINTTHTNPLVADTDGDGWSDGVEHHEGTDPNNPASFPRYYSHLVNYQGRLMDNLGMPVNGPVPMVFGLYDGATSATPLWTESQTVTVTQGIYNVLLGSMNPLSTSIFTAANSMTFFLQVTVNGQALSPRSRLTSAPIAMFAERLMGGTLASRDGNFNLNGASQVTVHVAFERAFQEQPEVFISPPAITIGGEKFIGETSNITATGFDVTFESISGRAVIGWGHFSYLAFGN